MQVTKQFAQRVLDRYRGAQPEDTMQAGIDPAFIEMIMQLVQQLTTLCFNQSSVVARVKGCCAQCGAGEICEDAVRLGAMIRNWRRDMGISPFQAPVFRVRKALLDEANEAPNEELHSMYDEFSFLAI